MGGYGLCIVAVAAIDSDFSTSKSARRYLVYSCMTYLWGSSCQSRYAGSEGSESEGRNLKPRAAPVALEIGPDC